MVNISLVEKTKHHLGRTDFSAQKRQLVYNEICLSSYVRPLKSMLVFDFVSSSLCFRSTNDCSSAFCHLYLIQNTFFKTKIPLLCHFTKQSVSNQSNVVAAHFGTVLYCGVKLSQDLKFWISC